MAHPYVWFVVYPSTVLRAQRRAGQSCNQPGSQTGVSSFVWGGALLVWSPTKWPPAGYWCACFWPQQTQWGWHEGLTSSRGVWALFFPWSKSNWAPMGRCISVHMTLPSNTTDHPGAHWCPDYSSGACPDVVGSTYGHVGAIHPTESHYELNQAAIYIMYLITWFSACFWTQASLAWWFQLQLTVVT